MSTNTTTSSHHHRKSSHNHHRRHDSNSLLGVSTIGHRQQNRKLDDNANANANASSSSHDDYAQKLTTKVLELLKEDSPFFDSNPPSIFPTFSSGELQVAPKELGRGEFGIVWRILALHTEDCPCPKCHGGSGGGPAKLSSSSKTAVTDNTTTGTSTTAETGPNAHEPLVTTPIDYSTKPTPQQPASTLRTTATINTTSQVRDQEAEKPPLLEIGPPPPPPAPAATTSVHSKTPPTTIITAPTAAAVAAAVAVAVDLTPSSSSPPPRSPRTAPASVDTPQQQQRASRGVVLHRRHTSRISFSEDVITKRTDSDDSSLSTEADDDESLIEGAAAFEKMRRRNNNKNNNINNSNHSSTHKKNNNKKKKNNNNNSLNNNDNNSPGDDSMDENNNEDGEAAYLRGYMSRHCMRRGRSRYAVKRLRNDLNGPTRMEATVDLAVEATFLSSLVHPNIVKMRGTVGTPGQADFGIIMDCLVETLGQKMVSWKEEYHRHHKTWNVLKSFFHLLQQQQSQKQQQHREAIQEYQYSDKLLAMYDIARAMRYLHNHS